MSCKHHVKCGDCFSPEMVAGLDGEIARLRSDLSNERAAHAEAERLLEVERKRVEALTSELQRLGAMKAAEIGPVLDRFRAAFGVEVPPLPAGMSADAARINAAHKAIEGLTGEAKHEAMRRLSVSYSDPTTAVQRGGRIEGTEIVWPDGMRCPMRLTDAIRERASFGEAASDPLDPQGGE